MEPFRGKEVKNPCIESVFSFYPQKRLKKVRIWVDKEEKWCIIMILRLEVEVAVLEKRLKKVRISFDKDEFDAKVKPRAS